MRRGVERLRREIADRLPLGPDGIVHGAGPIALDGDPSRAVLLVHGFGDAPDSLAGLAARLHAAGWTVRAPLLPGHGRTLDEFARSTADAWLAHARDAYRALRATHPHVALVGQSMGATLSILLAVESPPPSLVLLAPYLSMPRTTRLAATLHPLVALVAPWIASRSPRSIHDPAARAASRGYGAVAPHLLHRLAAVADRGRAALPHVTPPTRVVASRLDNRVPAASVATAFARLGAPTKELVWLEACGHVITVDRERERVYELVAEWIGKG